jgi:glycosyltransferase involved in cell wall biosynthesis
MSVYVKEDPEYLDLALKSIWHDQILKPDEIILVKDGVLTEELDIVIDKYAREIPMNVVALEKNVGLGIALNIGMKNCSHEIIARMDSDDIALPIRFAKQIEFLKANPDIVLVSGNILEFDKIPNDGKVTRKVPTKYMEILRFSKKRNPMNHMVVMFRKSPILNVGSYQAFQGYEDYYLWVRLLNDGYKAANLNTRLAYVRIGNNMYERRRGIKFFHQEIRLQNKFLRMSYINKLEFLQNIILRAFPRLLPASLLCFVYKFLRK